MQEKDADLVLKAKVRNNLETYCFEMINTLADDNLKSCFPEISVSPLGTKHTRARKEFVLWLILLEKTRI